MKSIRIAALLCAAQLAPLPAQTAAPSPQRPARTVAAVRPAGDVARDAARLDQLLERGLRRLGQQPLPTIDDAGFVRRAYLTILGRIPTLDEVEAFLADQDPGKRTLLCDRLLDSPGRTSHFANFWFDLLRVKSSQQNLSGEPFAHFVRSAIQQDMPYDEFVRRMLVAEGAGHAEGNGATGMLLRDMNMPHDAMANAMRLFLGTRLECAQCHNHPTEHWTQKQFFQMAAFFGGLRYRDENALPNLVGLRGELANAEQQTRQRALQLLRRMNQGLDGSGTGIDYLPADYAYTDAAPRSPIQANTILGAEVRLRYPKQAPERRPVQPRARRGPAAPEIGSRQALADWLTSPRHPLFAKVIANRMWARTFGAGLVEPLDDWKKDTVAVHPELFAQLEKLMVELRFDLRQFERVLVHTALFQRESPADDGTPGAAVTFRGPLLRRMSAEQLWDSLLTLVFDDLDERLRPMDHLARPVYDQFAELSRADAKQLLEMVQRRPGMPPRMAEMEQREAIQRELAADAELQRRARPLLRELAEARRNGDQAKVVDLANQLQAMGVPLGLRAGRGREGDLVRASDLVQPAPAGHLLQQFGQSDRNTVDAARTTATVPQVLTLLNGFLDQRVLEGQSALRRDLEMAPDGERRVRVAFLTTLNREPTPDELATWRKQIAIHGDVVVKDLVWVLCNSNEFRFVR